MISEDLTLTAIVLDPMIPFLLSAVAIPKRRHALMDPPLLHKCKSLVKFKATRQSDRQLPSAAQLLAFPAGAASAGAEPPLVQWSGKRHFEPRPDKPGSPPASSAIF